MIGYNRQQAKALGLSKCYGSICQKHPELEGYRWVSGACIECARDYVRNARKNDPDKRKKHNKKSYDRIKANPELWAKKIALDVEYRKNNKAKIRESQRRWKENNPDRVALHKQNAKGKYKIQKNVDTAFRRSAKKQRTPRWLTPDDFWMIEQVYELAALRTKMFGFKWHVDHIIPLQGKTVSGLHVPWNLQVIPALVNLKKGNKIVEARL